MSRPIVLGAGPAGSTAAILLARNCAEPILIDRHERVGDAICGGFVSWRTAKSLRELGCDPVSLGAHRLTKLRIFAGKAEASANLPTNAFGISRHALDTALRNLAVESGAQLEIDKAREVRAGSVAGERCEWRSPAIFLATGKHDVRGEARPRESADPALGLRVRLPPTDRLAGLIGAAIELHMFPGGYAGIVLQEDGSANVCLALRKSLLTDARRDPFSLLHELATTNPHFANRIAGMSRALKVDTIGSVPYGWIAANAEDGLYRLGDQAAVIPSLAGEGMAIALGSARCAADAYLNGRSAQEYQTRFAAQARRPVRVAKMLWRLAETSGGANVMTGLTKRLPSLARLAMRFSRF